MKLNPPWQAPACIDVLRLSGQPIEFEADMPTMDLLFDQDISLVRDWMEDATERAKLAFAAASVEWSAWRLEGTEAHQDLLAIAQALWAAMLDIRYWKGVERTQPEPGTPLDWIRFSIWQESEALIRMSSKRRGKAKAGDIVHLVLIARHILPKPAVPALKKWLTTVLDGRIGVHWQLDDDPRERALRLGPPVSREALDTALPFDEVAMAGQVDALMQRIDWHRNPYLRSPEELRAIDFDGMVYAL